MPQTKGRGQIIEKGKEKYQVKIFRGRDADGKKLYFSKVINGKKSVAQKFLTSKLREKDLGTFIDNSRQTLNEHLDNWLRIIRTRVAEQTYDSYESLLRIHVRPRIGQARLSDIKIHDVQQVYFEIELSELSARTVHYVHTVLKMALKKAVELNYIIKNPCEFVELPKQENKETKALSPAQTLKFLEYAKHSKHGLIFEFAIVSGMRPEEYLSIQWSDVDFSRNMVSVQRALVWKKGGGFKFDNPKTKKSRRSISMPEDLMKKLKDHRRRQLKYRLKLGQAFKNLDLVFVSDVGTPIHYRNLTLRYYQEILEQIKLDEEGFVLYSLRHTCATLLLIAGENPKVVSERLGHSSVRITLDTYSHLLPDLQQNASDKLETMLYRTVARR